jgi:hypothetical protein
MIRISLFDQLRLWASSQRCETSKRTTTDAPSKWSLGGCLNSPLLINCQTKFLNVLRSTLLRRTISREDHDVPIGSKSTHPPRRSMNTTLSFKGRRCDLLPHYSPHEQSPKLLLLLIRVPYTCGKYSVLPSSLGLRGSGGGASPFGGGRGDARVAHT